MTQTDGPNGCDRLDAWLESNVRAADMLQGCIVMLCGLAGSGKTTAAKRLEHRGMVRLSIDEEIWERNGRYGMDYDAALYPVLQLNAEERLWQRLATLISEKMPVVIDYSFWQRSARLRYRQLIADHQRRCILLYLKASAETLRARLRQRNHRFDANAAFPIDDAVLDRFAKTFEEPDGEGEKLFLVDN